MRIIVYSGIILASLLVVSCGSSQKDEKGKIGDLKVEIQKMKDQKSAIDKKILEAEAQLAKLDPASARVEKTKLVSIMPLTTQNFTHYIDLQGKVDADNISYVAPRNGVGGLVKAIYVKKGDYVKRGQLMLKLDDAVYLKNLEQLKSQLSFAQNIYQRQKNLWDQNIGTEVQVLTAKNNVEAIDRQIATLKEQWSMTNVYADANGVADEVNVRVGEMFQGAGMGGAQIRIVNTSSLKVVTDIPENYLSRVRRGTPVEVSFPDVNKKVSTSVSFIGSIIGPNSRGFMTECKLNGVSGLSPNQIAMVRILDYSVANTIVVPVTVIQTDDKGKYVYVTETNGNKMVARKKPVGVGESYEGMIEIRAGLKAGDQLITEGYQTLYDGQLISAVAPQ
jgi:membrane fusion protein, multidrug efflux system